MPERLENLDRENVAVSVVLPAHNEIGLLGPTVLNIVAGLTSRGTDFEIVIVENGSTDGTRRLARLLSAQLPQLRIVELDNANYGAALSAGFAAARGATIVSFDVDYYELTFFDTAIALIEQGKAAIVLASKRAPGAQDHRPLFRRLLTDVFTSVVRTVLSLKVSDAHGMKVIDKTQLGPILRRCVMRGSVFDVEMVVRAARAGLAISEIPAAVIERRPPRTSVAGRVVESFLGVLRLWLVLEVEKDASVERVARIARPARLLRKLRVSSAGVRRRFLKLSPKRRGREKPRRARSGSKSTPRS